MEQPKWYPREEKFTAEELARWNAIDNLWWLWFWKTRKK